jgi:iron complex outermembrane receptor protein
MFRIIHPAVTAGNRRADVVSRIAALTAAFAMPAAFALAAERPALPETRGAAQPGDLAALSVAQSQPVANPNFAIPPQPLSSALTAFGQQSGYQVSVDHSQLAGLSTAGVSGRMPPEDALKQLLAGTGVTWRFTDDKSVVLTRADGDAMTLDPITVEGKGETAWGPVDGFVATRSATGTKADTPIIETPQSISVVTSDQMKATKPRSLSQAIEYTPSVTSQSPAFSRMVDDLSLRGFNVANGNLGMLRDGMKLQSNVYDGGQEPYGLERIEVLRGPASILYGQLGPGGAVNAVTKRPTIDPIREVNVEYGSYDRIQGSADFGGSITEDGSWSYRVTGLVREADSWVNHVNDDKRYGAVGLTWRPTLDTAFTALGNYQNVSTKFAPPMPYQELADGVIPRDLFIGEPDYDKYDGDVFTIGYLFEHRFNETFKFRNNLRYYHADVTFDYLTYGALQPDDSLTRGVSNRHEMSSGFTTDLSLETRLRTGPADHTVLAGADIYRRTYDRDRFPGSVAPLNNIYEPVYGATPVINDAVNIGFESSSDQVGFYLQDQVKIFDKLVLLLGGRQDWSSSDQYVFFTNSRTRQTDQAFTGRAGLVYLFDSGIAPYASFSQSFSPISGGDRNGDPFVPSRGTQYEAGVRYEPPKTNILVSAAVYQLTQTNVLTPDPVDSSFNIQTGEVRSRGVELEGKASVGNLNLTAAYAYTDSRTTKSNIPTLEGQRSVLVPYNAVAFWADYTLDAIGLRGLRIGAGVRYEGSTNIPGFSEDVPSRTLVDALVAYDLGGLDTRLEGASLAVNVSNLFDEDYYTCVSDDGCRYGAPRLVTGTLSYRW